jgi:hypothetical protein
MPFVTMPGMMNKIVIDRNAAAAAQTLNLVICAA